MERECNGILGRDGVFTLTLHSILMTLEIIVNLVPPEFNNSAGRLLCLLKMFDSRRNYFDTIVQFYGFNENPQPHIKAQAYLEFMAMVGSIYYEFIADLESSSAIPNEARVIIKEGLASVIHSIYPIEPNNVTRKLQEAEIALLRMAASMLPQEESLQEDDMQLIRASIDELQNILEHSDLKSSARTALLEIIRLSRNAIDYYSIHGAKGFKLAFKNMLADLMEIYLHEGKQVTKESWWTKAMEHVRKIDVVASKLLKYKPLLEGIQRLFLTGS